MQILKLDCPSLSLDHLTLILRRTAALTVSGVILLSIYFCGLSAARSENLKKKTFSEKLRWTSSILMHVFFKWDAQQSHMKYLNYYQKYCHEICKYIHVSHGLNLDDFIDNPNFPRAPVAGRSLQYGEISQNWWIVTKFCRVLKNLSGNWMTYCVRYFLFSLRMSSFCAIIEVRDQTLNSPAPWFMTQYIKN